MTKGATKKGPLGSQLGNMRNMKKHFKWPFNQLLLFSGLGLFSWSTLVASRSGFYRSRPVFSWSTLVASQSGFNRDSSRLIITFWTRLSAPAPSPDAAAGRGNPSLLSSSCFRVFLLLLLRLTLLLDQISLAVVVFTQSCDPRARVSVCSLWFLLFGIDAFDSVETVSPCGFVAPSFCDCASGVFWCVCVCVCLCFVSWIRLFVLVGLVVNHGEQGGIGKQFEFVEYVCSRSAASSHSFFRIRWSYSDFCRDLKEIVNKLQFLFFLFTFSSPGHFD